MQPCRQRRLNTALDALMWSRRNLLLGLAVGVAHFAASLWLIGSAMACADTLGGACEIPAWQLATSTVLGYPLSVLPESVPAALGFWAYVALVSLCWSLVAWLVLTLFSRKRASN